MENGDSDIDPEDFRDSLDITPEIALQDALKAIHDNLLKDEDGNPAGPPPKALIIFLYDEGEQYGTKFYNAGMCCSEMIALLDIMKSRVIKIINND